MGLHCLPMSLLWDARLKWVNLCVVWNISGETTEDNQMKQEILIEGVFNARNIMMS